MKKRGEEITTRYTINFAQLSKIIRNPELSFAEKAVFIDLLLYAGTDGKCNPSQLTLAVNHGCSDRYIGTIIKKLKSRPLVDYKSGGFGNSNEYFFNEELYFTTITEQIYSEMSSESGTGVPTNGINNSKEKKNLGNLYNQRQEIVEEVRSRPILEVANHLGLLNSFSPGNIKAIQCINSAAHKNGDKHPSLILKPNKNKFECKSCDIWGGVIDLVMYTRQLDFNEAVSYLDPRFSELKSRSEKIDPSTYIQSRGINQEMVQKFGLRMEKDRLVIPLPNGGEKYRWINSTKSRYSFKKGPGQCLFKTKESYNSLVFLTEGELDAIKLHQETNQAVWSTTGGVGTFYSSWLSYFERINNIYICYDNDEAGKAGAKKVADLLGEERCTIVNLPEGVKDVGEFFIKGYTCERFKALVKKSEKGQGDLFEEGTE